MNRATSIEEQIERNFLPEECKFAHEYCFFLHDVLASIVVQGEHEGIFNYGFKLRESNHVGELKGKSGEELAIWLEQNGYEEEFHEVSRRQIWAALLSDFCHFIFEALKCSQKGKLTVTFALLRKPLKENLFYLEWLLADPLDFTKRFHTPATSKGPHPLLLPPEPSSVEKRLLIIQTAVHKSGLSGWVPPEFIYELRYDKKCSYGLEQLFQRATHLITTFVAKTEDQNFNFVFSGDEARQSQWQKLYTLLPVILLHALGVVYAAIRGFDEGKLEAFNSLNLRALIGFLLHMDSGLLKSESNENLGVSINSLAQIKISCLSCQSEVSLDGQNLNNLYYEGVVECYKCGYKAPLTTNHEILILSRD